MSAALRMIAKNCRILRLFRQSPTPRVSGSLTWKAMKASLLHVSKSVLHELYCVTFKPQQKFLLAAAIANYSTPSWASHGYQSRPDGLLRIRGSLHAGNRTGACWRICPAPVHISSSTQVGIRHVSSISTTSETSAIANHAKPSTQTELPSHRESRRSHISKKFSHVMDNLQSNIFIAGQRLNDLTGYSGIEALKKEIEGQGRPTYIFEKRPN